MLWIEISESSSIQFVPLISVGDSVHMHVASASFSSSQEETTELSHLGAFSQMVRSESWLIHKDQRVTWNMSSKK